jgi:uncharacterized membrane protein YkoI
MKIMSVSLICFVFLLQSCSSQDISASKVPSVVLNTFKENHAAKDVVEWKKLQNVYEAEVALNDSTELSLQIDDAGKLLMQKQDVAIAELPPVVLASVQNELAGYTIDDAEKLERNGMAYYQFELEGKGKKDRKLVLTADGKEDNTIKYWD